MESPQTLEIGDFMRLSWNRPIIISSIKAMVLENTSGDNITVSIFFGSIYGVEKSEKGFEITMTFLKKFGTFIKPGNICKLYGILGNEITFVHSIPGALSDGELIYTINSQIPKKEELIITFGLKRNKIKCIKNQ